MQPDNSVSLLFILLIVMAFPLIFIPFWCFVVWLLSRLGGWGRLASFYRAVEPFTGQTWTWRGGRLGFVNYRSVLTLGADPAGLYLAVMPLFRVGHAPLWIPWSEIEVVERDGILGLYMGFRFAQAPDVVLYLLPNLGGRLLAVRDVHRVSADAR
ncbi:MAG TPA: hypothetical protein PKH77_02260 [Anaerolineae bacterium]|nr:hypothetical protein [Anaerolineae bacterium]